MEQQLKVKKESHRSKRVAPAVNTGAMEEELVNDLSGLDLDEFDNMLQTEQRHQDDDDPSPFKIKSEPMPKKNMLYGLKSEFQGIWNNSALTHRDLFPSGFKNLRALVPEKHDPNYTLDHIQVKDEDGDDQEILPFYWMDIQEHPTDQNAAIVYGKVRSNIKNPASRNYYASCQLTVRNINREITFYLKKGANP